MLLWTWGNRYLLELLFWVSSGYIFRTRIAGSFDSSIFNFWGSSILFVIVASCSVYHSTVLPTLHILTFSTSSLLLAVSCLLMIWGDILLSYFLVEQTLQKFCHITKHTVAEDMVMRAINSLVFYLFYLAILLQLFKLVAFYAWCTSGQLSSPPPWRFPLILFFVGSFISCTSWFRINPHFCRGYPSVVFWKIHGK